MRTPFSVSVRRAKGLTMDPDNVSSPDEDRDQGEDEQDLLPA
jgi:hypothetical protein